MTTQKTWTLHESSVEATNVFRTIKPGQPRLIQTGFPPVDDALGGLFPGSVGILGAGTGVGKSRLMLCAAMSSGNRAGIISLEDTPDVLGSRVLAVKSGVSSMRIRTKDLTPKEVEALQQAQERLQGEDHIRVAYPIAAPLADVLVAIEALAAEGCEMIWVDYVQKIRGHNQDRRNEVSSAFSALQYTANRAKVALMVVCQFSRQPDPTKPPQISWLKESGDLENEARLILLAHRPGTTDVHVRVAKSTFGGEGIEFAYRTAEHGMLELITEEEDDDLF
jgi:replicative DNA helicase